MELSRLLAAERRIEALARPHGVIDRPRLLRAGFSRSLIDRRVKAGWLRPMHRGVYAVGPVQSDEAPEMAAVLACGERAVLSHRSAAALWSLLSNPARPVEVMVAASHLPRRSRVRVRRTGRLMRDEVTTLRRIRVTTPARTVLDLAWCLSARELEQALAKAERLYAGTQRRLRSLLVRYPHRAGTAALRALLGADQPAMTRSEAEQRFLALIRRARLPAPEVNVFLNGYELDFLWRDEALAVEIDGFAFHGDRAAFEADRRRDADLAAHGVQVIRATWRQIAEEPEALVVLLAQARAERR